MKDVLINIPRMMKGRVIVARITMPVMTIALVNQE
jgi:hypothetical protein